jgi:hypothetical protein
MFKSQSVAELRENNFNKSTPLGGTGANFFSNRNSQMSTGK